MRLHAVRCVSLVLDVGALHDGGGCGQLGGCRCPLTDPCGPLKVPEGPCHHCHHRISEQPHPRPAQVSVLYRFDSHLRLVAKSLDSYISPPQTGQKG
jgi:hypothetical protein